MVACNLQEPRNTKLQNTAFLQTGCVLKSHKIFLQGLHGVSSTPLQFSENTVAGAKFKKWMSVLNWWSSTYDLNRIYIYTYYEIYYVDLLNLMLTVLLLNQGCSLGSFASIPWKRKTNLNYLQMVKKEGWPHLTRPDQMKWGERPNSFVAHVYHVLLGLPAVFV